MVFALSQGPLDGTIPVTARKPVAAARGLWGRRPLSQRVSFPSKQLQALLGQGSSITGGRLPAGDTPCPPGREAVATSNQRRWADQGLLCRAEWLTLTFEGLLRGAQGGMQSSGLS